MQTARRAVQKSDATRPAIEHRALAAAIVAAVLLVVARSLVFAVYEQANFDSDQAIVGLMAKHLAEGRALPLFFYGQTYMLAVEAWLAAPVLWIAGPTVAALRASLILTNGAVAVCLLIGLHRWGGLRPAAALVATAFFTVAPPRTSAFLVEAQGGNIEPFLYVLVAWFLRRRPFWLGAVLAMGFLNREFSIYAVPVLLAAEAIEGTLWRADGVRRWLFTALTFLVVWDGVLAVRPYADLAGPGTHGSPLGGFPGSQIDNLTARARLTPAELPGRAAVLGTDLYPRLLGGVRIEDPVAAQGRKWIGYLLAVGLIAGLVRIAMLSRRGALPPAASFGWYLLGLGVVASVAYVLTRSASTPTLRYVLLALYLPIGVTAVWLAAEPRAWIRRALAAGVMVWAAAAVWDHLQLTNRYRRGTEPNDIRVLADALEARGVRVAEAPYWRAYKLSYLTGERVKVASTDVVRIEEYQRLAQAEPRLTRIRDAPCPGGEHVVFWYLCRD